MTKRHALTALALAAALAVAACGDDDDDSGGSSTGKADPQSGKAIFTISGSGKSTKVTGPSEARAGVLEFQLKNDGKKPAGLQIVGYEGDHTPEEILKAGNAWGDGKAPLPGYVKLEGGIGNVAPGETGVVRQSVSAGKYLALNIDTDAYTEFEITGDGTGTLRVDQRDHHGVGVRVRDRGAPDGGRRTAHLRQHGRAAPPHGRRSRSTRARRSRTSPRSSRTRRASLRSARRAASTPPSSRAAPSRRSARS